ncbi:hypothetical protein ANRL4_00954 [Anaerolineae bacterium]|nr:hypothetical protein ANRL4_00954 [Anaerolineae bacterium]
MINRETKKQGLTLMKTEKKDKRANYVKPSLVRYGGVEKYTNDNSGSGSDGLGTAS